MEKERKGLFEMLAELWKEKAEGLRQESIRFWAEQDPLEKSVKDVFLEERTALFSNEKVGKQEFFTVKKEFLPGETFLEEKAEKDIGQGSEFYIEEASENRKILFLEEEEQIPLREENVEEERTSEWEQKRKNQVSLKETKLDIEALMQEITKKLWEEREGCGRRLR